MEVSGTLPFLERALATATEHELHHGTIRASSHLAHALVLLGERERGLECRARSLEMSREAGTAEWHAHGTATGYGTVTASVYLAAGCPEEARAAIRQGLAAAAERNARGYRAPLLRLEAEVLVQEDPIGARERLEEALAVAVELGMRPEAAHCHLGLGKLHRRAGPREPARDHLIAATAMYREMAMPFWLSQAEMAMADPA